ncbi:Leucine Rich Repeat domain protein [Pelomyxa schiedti]|nr:Leucine Rich Repeat domain protein [Pelomyxa schiedti]
MSSAGATTSNSAPASELSDTVLFKIENDFIRVNKDALLHPVAGGTDTFFTRMFAPGATPGETDAKTGAIILQGMTSREGCAIVQFVTKGEKVSGKPPFQSKKHRQSIIQCARALYVDPSEMIEPDLSETQMRQMVKAASLSSLSEIWLPHTNLSNLSFCQVSFKKAILSSSDLSGCSFKSCNLSGCNFSGCTFSHTCLTNCNLAKSDFSGCAFTDASMNSCTFIGSALSNTSLLNSSITTSSFEACHVQELFTITSCQFSQSSFQTDMTHFKFHSTVFTGTSFSDCDLSRADLKGVTMRSCQINRGCFTEAEVRGVDFSGAKFSAVDLTRLDLSGCILSECEFDRVCFLGVAASGVNFSSSKFQAADFTQADLSKAQMRACIFNETCFSESMVTGVDFTSSQFIGGTVLTKVKGNNVAHVNFNSVQADFTMLLNWTGLVMMHTNFTSCKFRGTIFSVMPAISCVFDNADFTGADFTSCHFPDNQAAGITWTGVTMAAVRGFETIACKSSEFRDSQFSDIQFKDRYWTFQNCSFTNVQLKDVYCTLQNCSFTGCNIEALLIERVPTALSFSNCVMKNVDFSSLPAQATLLLKSCSVTGTKFQSNHIEKFLINDCTVEESDLNECSGLNIDGSKFFKCDFLCTTFQSTLDCSFSSSCLRGLLLQAPERPSQWGWSSPQKPISTLIFDHSDISFTLVKRFHITKLSSCSMFHSSFEQCDLDPVVFEDDCTHVAFRKCSLKSANFSHANMSHSAFLECDLSGADMTGADLSGTEMAHTNLQSVVMSDTILSKKTKLHQCNLAGAVIKGNDLLTKMVECPLVGVKQEEITWVGKDLTQKNFSGSTLHKVDFSGANMSKVDLSYACASPEIDCQGRKSPTKDPICPANFSGANLTEANLIGVDFHQVNFSGATLTRALLVGQSQRRPTVLEGANLCQTRLESVDLHGSNLAGAQFDKGSTLINVNLEGCCLTGALLSEVDLRTTRLKGAQLDNAQLQKAQLTGCDLSKTSLTGDGLIGANLDMAILEEATLTGGHLHNIRLVQLKGARFHGVRLENVDLQEGHLEGVSFSNCTWYNVNLERAHLDKATISGSGPARLSFAILRGVNMENVDLQYTNFTGADLSDCNFTGATLTDVYFNNSTLWRSSFCNAKLRHVSFEGAKLQNTDFRRAIVSQCNLNTTEADQSTNFDEATFQDTTFSRQSFKYCGTHKNSTVKSNCKYCYAGIEGRYESRSGLIPEMCRSCEERRNANRW